MLDGVSPSPHRDGLPVHEDRREGAQASAAVAPSRPRQELRQGSEASRRPLVALVRNVAAHASCPRERGRAICALRTFSRGDVHHPELPTWSPWVDVCAHTYVDPQACVFPLTLSRRSRFLIHKSKQRLTKITQFFMRTRKLLREKRCDAAPLSSPRSRSRSRSRADREVETERLRVITVDSNS